MKQRVVDINMLVVMILTIVAVVLVFIVPSEWLALRILTLPLVFVLPGYALMRALFSGQAFGNAERLIFSLGLSLSIVILGGLVLNLTSFGLQARSWVVFLGAVTLGASLVALLRQRRQGETVEGWSGLKGIHLTFRQGLLASLAVLVVGGAFVVSIIGAQQQPRSGFTQLWMLSASGTSKAEDAVRLGLSNKESRPMQYRLAVDMNGKVMKEWSAIDLSPNQQWEATLVLPQTGHSSSERVEAMLYRTDAPTKIYRDVVLWLGTT
jgi:uncharacterized membrane protein